MSKIRLRYVDQFRDLHGHTRYYFRRPGGKRTPLPGLPGSAEFMAAYAAAEADKGKQASSDRGGEGTFDRLLSLYFQSPEFKRLKAGSTQRAYRLAMERLVRLEGIGHRSVREMPREAVKAIMAKRADRPSAANGALKKLRILLRFAVDIGWRRDDPTLNIRKFAEGEHHTWTDPEIEAFETRWPLGSVERTAFALLLYTGQRIGDIAACKWADIDATGISFKQQKTGTELHVPIHPALREALAAWPRNHLTFVLVTAFLKPFSVKGLGNKMADAIHRAGLPERCVAHGLRKAAARRLAEAGCSANEIASITGHASLAEVSRYTKAADQRRLGPQAIARLPGGKG